MGKRRKCGEEDHDDKGDKKPTLSPIKKPQLAKQVNLFPLGFLCVETFYSDMIMIMITIIMLLNHGDYDGDDDCDNTATSIAMLFQYACKSNSIQ